MNTRTQYTSTKISVGEKTVESRGVHTTIFFQDLWKIFDEFIFLEFLYVGDIFSVCKKSTKH